MDWRTVIWSDEAIFEVGKRGRIWATERVDENAVQIACGQFIGEGGSGRGHEATWMG